MDNPKFKGPPFTKWIPQRACYRISAMYYTPGRRIAAAGIMIYCPASFIGGWLHEGIHITGILVVDVAYGIVWSTLMGFFLATLFCERCERIEISKDTISFGRFAYTRTYDASLPHGFEIAPLPPPHPTRWHKQAVIVTFRIGKHRERFTIWNKKGVAERLIERFRAVEDAVQAGMQTDRQRFIQRFFAARSSGS